MKKTYSSERHFPFSDLFVLFVISILIYGMFLIAQQWQGDFRPVTEINLSLWSLPGYVLLSAFRGLEAYALSLFFTLIVGYIAAKSKLAEKIIIPAIDILQSVPTLGFLPGLVLGLITLFPDSNIGLELSAVLLIFSGQVWNMVFCYYTTLKSIPNEYQEAADNMGLSWWEKMWQIEIPSSIMSLAWNSLLSMAGGWFYLTVCEAFVLGDKEFRLPGIGAYMAEAIKAGNSKAIIAGIIAMGILIIGMDFLLWRPILAWAQRFRSENFSDDENLKIDEPLLQFLMQESAIIEKFERIFRKIRGRSLFQEKIPLSHKPKERINKKIFKSIQTGVENTTQVLNKLKFNYWIGWLILFILAIFTYWAGKGLTNILIQINLEQWKNLMIDLVFTILRVFGAVLLASIWAIPFGVWIGISAKRTRIAQPIIQILASFPAPMIYPLLLSLCLWIGISFGFSSMLLMFVGIQWYVLFNVLAGSLRIPKDLSAASKIMNLTIFEKWKNLYLPSIFPDLVAGWVTAAGGAWNASIVAEYIEFKGSIHNTRGLGSTLAQAAADGNLPMMTATLSLMIFAIVLLNRLLWVKLFNLAENRFRMES